MRSDNGEQTNQTSQGFIYRYVFYLIVEFSLMFPLGSKSRRMFVYLFLFLYFNPYPRIFSESE